MDQERKKIEKAMEKEIKSFFVRGKISNESETPVAEESTNTTQDLVNYFEIHGTVPGSFVAAKSHLCEDIHEEFSTRS